MASLVCDRLAHMGKFEKAGDLMLAVRMVKEALDMFMSGEAWEKARDIARNIAPKYVIEVIICGELSVVVLYCHIDTNSMWRKLMFNTSSSTTNLMR